MRQPSLRDLAACVAEWHCAAPGADRRRAILAAQDAAPLAQFREALRLGRLVVCGSCSRFTFGENPAGAGQCARWAVEAYPFVAFYCEGYERLEREER